ncbi:hypothetical protein ACFPTO_13475 [Paraburkholderia denitrificans]|uniref:Uncharacterized protein n=1 Tax=Paraburkholderia denitrificans TaxID=694025 RepID=A0ABW0JA53_9BURK
MASIESDYFTTGKGELAADPDTLDIDCSSCANAAQRIAQLMATAEAA